MKWFTSDTHFGHKNIIRYSNRPYRSVDEMNEALIDSINQLVQPNDELYHLGDFAFSDEEATYNIVKRLNGKKHFIYGNHDKTIKRSHDIQNLFESVSTYSELYFNDAKLGKIPVVLCHYPMITWNKAHHGSFMLHGHCHGNLRYPFPARIMDVGVDPQGYVPISEQTIIKRLSTVVIQKVDHHGD